MDFLNQFIQIALGRMIGGGTDAGIDQASVGAGGGGSWASAAQDIPQFINSVRSPDPTKSGEEQAQQVALAGAQGVGDYFTGGLVGMFRGFAEKHWPGTMDKLEHADRQINPLYKLFGHLMPGKSA